MQEEIMKRLNNAMLEQLEAREDVNETLLKLVSVHARMRQVELLSEIVEKLGDIDISLMMIADKE